MARAAQEVEAVYEECAEEHRERRKEFTEHHARNGNGGGKEELLGFRFSLVTERLHRKKRKDHSEEYEHVNEEL